MLGECNQNRIMKISDVVSTGFTISVGCSLLFLGYVHFTSQNVHFHRRAGYPDSLHKSEEHQRIHSDFLKNLNESIRRMEYDTEYTLKNLSFRGELRGNEVGPGEEGEEDDEPPLFIDVMKVSRLTNSKGRGLPDAKESHDLSGYVSILHPEQTLPDLKCKICSVVCNSGHLLHSKLGRTIDSADCIFRMNDAPSRGYSRDVGSRTTLRMVGFQAMPKVLENKDVLLMGSTRPRYVAMWGPERELTANGTGKGYNHLRALAMMLERGGTEAIILSSEEMAYNDKVYEAETGYHSDVGVRTTVRVLSHASVSSLFKSQKDLLGHPNATKILLAWGPHKFMKPGGASERRLKGLARNYPNVDFYIASDEEILYADQLFEHETGRPRSKSGSWLTTGWFTMILARSVCGEIHVYGMVGENYCRHEHGRKVPYHYYNPHSQDECEYYRSMEKSFSGGHRFMTEKAIFASWAKLTPKIYFHQPEWE